MRTRRKKTKRTRTGTKNRRSSENPNPTIVLHALSVGSSIDSRPNVTSRAANLRATRLPAIRGAIFDCEIAAFAVAGVLKALADGGDCSIIEPVA
jgi:hypothetical protein